MLGTTEDAVFPVFDVPRSTTAGGPAVWPFLGSYLQDEWRITNWLILSSGLSYDQYWAYTKGTERLVESE